MVCCHVLPEPVMGWGCLGRVVSPSLSLFCAGGPNAAGCLAGCGPTASPLAEGADVHRDSDNTECVCVWGGCCGRVGSSLS